jgi:heme oxygenase (staphylobilin-producing)
MINVIHTFQAPDHHTVLPVIRDTLQNIDNVTGFKYASINHKENSEDYLLVSKWDDYASFDNWAKSIGPNNPLTRTTPQFLTVMEEVY